MANTEKLIAIQKLRRAINALEDQLGVTPAGPERAHLEAAHAQMETVEDELILGEVKESVQALSQKATDLGALATKMRASSESLAKSAEYVEDAARVIGALASLADLALKAGLLG